MIIRMSAPAGAVLVVAMPAASAAGKKIHAKDQP
jgi:hypothetical protein